MHKTKFYLPKKKKTNKSPGEKGKSSKWSPDFVYKKTSSSNHPQEVRHKPSKLSSLPPTHTPHPCPPPKDVHTFVTIWLLVCGCVWLWDDYWSMGEGSGAQTSKRLGPILFQIYVCSNCFHPSFKSALAWSYFKYIYAAIALTLPSSGS